MANTGYILPQSAESASETPYNNADGAWATPQNIYGAGTANITSNSWDSGELSHVLKAYNFNLTSIPANSVINGVICRVVCSCTASATMNITLAQLLSTARATGGTNMASTPIAITPQAGATLSIGANNNNWGNSLTLAWLQDADFGVALGVTSGTNNADVYIDSVEIDVYYTPPNATTLTCDVTAYTVSGQDVALVKTLNLTASVTAYDVTGQDIATTNGKGYVLTCEVNAYAVTGQDITTTANYNYTLTAVVTDFTVIGQDIAFVKALTLTADVTNYTVTGQDITTTVNYNYTLSAVLTEYTVTGQDVTLTPNYNYTLSATLTEYTVTGQDITLIYAEPLTLFSSIKSLQYSLDGSPWARIGISSTMDLDSLQYSLDGSPWWGIKPVATEAWTTKSLKWHNGSIWVAKPLKTYVVDTWVTKSLKVNI